MRQHTQKNIQVGKYFITKYNKYLKTIRNNKTKYCALKLYWID